MTIARACNGMQAQSAGRNVDHMWPDQLQTHAAAKLIAANRAIQLRRACRRAAPMRRNVAIRESVTTNAIAKPAGSCSSIPPPDMAGG